MCSVIQHNDILSPVIRSGEATCPQCDLVVLLPQLACGTKACCPRCKTTLSSCWDEPRKRPVSYAISALLMLLLANLFPFISLRVAGITSEISLTDIPYVLLQENYTSMAMLFMVPVQGVPLFCLLAIVLLCRKSVPGSSFKIWLARILFRLKSWCMAEIFLAGVVVTLVKLMAYGDIAIGASFIPWCLFCLLQIRAFQGIDRRALWQKIARAPSVNHPLKAGESGMHQGLRSCHCCTAILSASLRRCPRCQTRGDVRRHHSLQWTIALLLTSIMLYIPANLMPVMVTQALGNTVTSTIMAGIIMLWEEGAYPVAVVIFIASIMVPLLKMSAIAWLCWNAHGKGSTDTERPYFIYRVVECVGRWSMIDVFVIALLSALVRTGKFMSISPSDGVILFAMVVCLTMFSAMAFDPRLTWDRISERAKNKDPPFDG